jgi:predicted nucleotidyltransferase component of viral defense system
MSQSLFTSQVDLLLRILPYVMHDRRFALKGGSALNLFVRDLPRLSVDIDLTYLPVATCNHNRSEPQSSQFWDQIKCNYPVV